MFAFLIKKYIAYLEDQRKVREKKEQQTNRPKYLKKIEDCQKKEKQPGTVGEIVKKRFC